MTKKEAMALLKAGTITPAALSAASGRPLTKKYANTKKAAVQWIQDECDTMQGYNPDWIADIEKKAKKLGKGMPTDVRRFMWYAAMDQADMFR